MKIPNSSAVLRQKLEGLVRQDRIAPSEVEQLLKSPEQLRAVLEREDAFDAKTKSAFDAVIGAPTKAGGEAVVSDFAPQSVQALLVTEKSSKAEAWFDNVDAKMPPLFDPGAATEAMSIGSRSIQAQDLIEMMSKVSGARSAWRGIPLVDTSALLALLR